MAMSCRFCTPRAVSTRATIRVPRSSSAVRVTCSGDSVMASITPSSPGTSRRAWRSSSHHAVPKPLMRTHARLTWPSWLREPSHAITFSRAWALSAGATESSTSSTTASAALWAAWSKRETCEPLTSSHERASSGPTAGISVGSMVMAVSAVVVVMRVTSRSVSENGHAPSPLGSRCGCNRLAAPSGCSVVVHRPVRAVERVRRDGAGQPSTRTSLDDEAAGAGRLPVVLPGPRP